MIQWEDMIMDIRIIIYMNYLLLLRKINDFLNIIYDIILNHGQLNYLSDATEQ